MDRDRKDEQTQRTRKMPRAYNSTGVSKQNSKDDETLTEENQRSIEDIQPPVASLAQNFSRRDAVKRDQYNSSAARRDKASKRADSAVQRDQMVDNMKGRPRTAAAQEDRQEGKRLNARSQRAGHTSTRFDVQRESQRQNLNQQDTEFDDSGSQSSQVHFQQITRDDRQRKKRDRELAIRTDVQSSNYENDYVQQQNPQDTEGNMAGQIDPRRQRNQQRSRFNSTNQNQQQQMQPQGRSKPRATQKLVDKLAHGLNWEPEFNSEQTLNQRAIEMVRSDEYLNKVKLIKAGNQQIKSMEFIMDGIKIELPYLGQKLTQGYLRKETQSVNILLKREFQTKFCMLDLTKFLFKYAKAPTESFTFIHLKDIIDVYVEPDPGVQPVNTKEKKSRSVFSTRSTKKEEHQGFNFQIKTSTRVYRMQAQTKTEQIMWLRALTILFELRARVSQNLKTTIDINHHLHDNRLANGLADTLSSAGISLDYSAHNFQRGLAGPEHMKSKSVTSKFNQNKNMQQQKRNTQDKRHVNDSQKEIDDLSIDSVDIDNVNLRNQRPKMTQKKAATGRPPTSSNKKPMRRGDEAEELSDYGDNDHLDGGAGISRAGKIFDKRQNRFQKQKNDLEEVDSQLEDYPDMKVKKRTEAAGEVKGLRSKSEILEEKKKEIARRLEANQRQMEKIKQLSEFQKDLDMQSMNLTKDFSNVQKDATHEVLKIIEKKKEALQEEAKEKESRINNILKAKTQAIDLKSSQLTGIPKQNPQDEDEEDEYYDEEEDYDEEQDQEAVQLKSPVKTAGKTPTKSPTKQPTKMRPREQAILNDLDNMMAPQRQDTEEPEIKSPVNQEKKLDGFVEKLIEQQENQKNFQVPLSATSKSKNVLLSTFELSKPSVGISTNDNRLNQVNKSVVEGKVAGSNVQSSRNESVRMSGTELLRQFRQSTQGGMTQLCSDKSLNKSGIFDMNKKKLKIVRNPKSPSPMRPLDSSTRNHMPMKTQGLEQFANQFLQTPNNNEAINQTFISDNQSVRTSQAPEKLNQTQEVFSQMAPAGGSRPKLKIKTIRLSQNAKNIIRQSKVQAQQKSLIEQSQSVLSNTSHTSNMRPNLFNPVQQPPLSATKPNASLFSVTATDYNPKSAGRAVPKPSQDLHQTMVEVLEPQLNLDEEDEGLGAWAGKIGARNKMKQEEKRQRENRSQVISFYDNFDKEKEQSLHDDNTKSEQMVLQDIDDDDDIVIQNVGKKKEVEKKERPQFKSQNFDDFLNDDVNIKSPKNIIKGSHHAFNTSQNKKESVKPQKDFSEILQREAGPSILDKVSKADANGNAYESLTFENKPAPFDHASEQSPGLKPPQYQYSRDSWLHNTNTNHSRGRKSNVLDDNRSEKEKMLDRQNSRKRNMLENSHHLHLSSSRKSITMQGQSTINHSVTRENERNTHNDSAAPVQNRRSLRPPSGSGQRPRLQPEDQMFINDSAPNSPTDSTAVPPQISKNFKITQQLNNQPINIKLNQQFIEEDQATKPATALPGQHATNKSTSSSKPGAIPSNIPPGGSSGQGGAPPLKNLGLSIENSNNTIVEQQNFDNRTSTNTTHVGKQVVNNYYILNVNSNSQASIDNLEAGANMAPQSQQSTSSAQPKAGAQKTVENEDFDYDW